jgi:hypothetical protein
LAEIKQQIANTNFDGTPINFNQLQFADPIYDLDNNLYTIRVTPVPNSTFYDNSSSLDLIIYADV